MGAGETSVQENLIYGRERQENLANLNASSLYLTERGKGKTNLARPGRGGVTFQKKWFRFAERLEKEEADGKIAFLKDYETTGKMAMGKKKDGGLTTEIFTKRIEKKNEHGDI